MQRRKTGPKPTDLLLSPDNSPNKWLFGKKEKPNWFYFSLISYIAARICSKWFLTVFQTQSHFPWISCSTQDIEVCGRDSKSHFKSRVLKIFFSYTQSTMVWKYEMKNPEIIRKFAAVSSVIKTRSIPLHPAWEGSHPFVQGPPAAYDPHPPQSPQSRLSHQVSSCCHSACVQVTSILPNRGPQVRE